MTKIPFQDGTKTQEAYVTIDGQNYNVTPAVWSGTTPLKAQNLNLMQDNIEDAIEEVKAVATTTSNGLMSKEDKTKLDSLEKTQDSDWQNLGYGTGYESPRIWFCSTVPKNRKSSIFARNFSNQFRKFTNFWSHKPIWKLTRGI